MDAELMRKPRGNVVYYRLVLLFFSLVLISNPCFAMDNYRPVTIVPGESVGEFNLGATGAPEVIRKLGKNTVKKVEYQGRQYMAFIYKELGLIFYFEYESKRLYMIDVFSPGLLVEGTSIHVGCDRALVTEQFNPEERDAVSQERRELNEREFTEDGIRFAFRRKTGKEVVAKITVFLRDQEPVE